MLVTSHVRSALCTLMNLQQIYLNIDREQPVDETLRCTFLSRFLDNTLVQTNVMNESEAFLSQSFILAEF